MEIGDRDSGIRKICTNPPIRVHLAVA